VSGLLGMKGVISLARILRIVLLMKRFKADCVNTLRSTLKVLVLVSTGTVIQVTGNLSIMILLLTILGEPRLRT
jgi:hypothetical protein